MTVARPLCSCCFKRHREPGTAKCADCGPGRIYTAAPPRRRPRPTPAERLGSDQADIETPRPANVGPTPTAEAP